MRIILGIMIILFIVAGAIFTVLALWGLFPISFTLIWKTLASIAIMGITALLTYTFYYLFFKVAGKKENS